MAERKGKADQVGNIILSKIIGERPRKPQTYAMRKLRGTEEDIEFCERYDKRLAEWEAKAEKVRADALKDREADKKLADEFEVKKVPPIIVNHKMILHDFKIAYKHQRRVEFNPRNPYSGTDEPNQFLYTLIFYFMRDDRFYDSPLLNKKLSVPSLDKGTLTIGGFGCGKSSTFNALIYTFKMFCKIVREKMPENQTELLNKYDINSCVSSDIVNKYNTTESKDYLDELMKPLMSYRQLYIDDILREQDANNYGKRNIFLDVLTHRADRDFKTHLTLNYLDENPKLKIGFQDIDKSLEQFAHRYDGRVHDRLFGMYNIIELKGKSFRR